MDLIGNRWFDNFNAVANRTRVIYEQGAGEAHANSKINRKALVC